MGLPLRFALELDTGDRLVVRAGRIASASAGADFVVPLGAGELRPGLINAHDHLYLNHYPRLGSPPYANMYEWGRDIHSRFADEVLRCSALPREDALRFGALKSLVGGATTVVHHDRWHPMLGEDFPVRAARVRVAHSLGFEADLDAAVRGDAETRGLPLCMHLAEGIDPAAAGEVARADSLGILSGMLAVHLVGVDAGAIATLRARDAALVWCPTSAVHLYGRTAPRALFAGGMDVLLGTDSLLSGAGTLLDELRAARELDLLDDARLTESVGAVAARRLQLPTPSLEPGAAADVVLLRRPLLDARASDVGLVLVRGVPRYGDEEFLELFRRSEVPVERITLGGAVKLVQAPLATVAERVRELTPEAARFLA
jgi:cytosine/adenosine deaminase-related metal-dependent hydrolase